MARLKLDDPALRGRLAAFIAGASGEGVGAIVFSPLAQGLLTDRYLDSVPPGSRASRPGTLDPAHLGADVLAACFEQRVGLGLGLDAIEHSLNVMAASPAAAGAVPELRQRLAQVRRINAKDYPAISN